MYVKEVSIKLIRLYILQFRRQTHTEYETNLHNSFRIVSCNVGPWPICIFLKTLIEANDNFLYEKLSDKENEEYTKS